LGGVAGTEILSNVPVSRAQSGGDEIWRFETGGPVFSSPTIVDDTVFIGSNEGSFTGAVYALESSSGEEVWKFDAGLSVGSSPTVVDETVFVGSNNGSIYALDAETGEELWVAELGDEIRSSPTVVDGTVFIGSSGADFEGTVYALDASSGERIWDFQTDSGVQSSPTVINETVFIGGGSIHALDESSGNEKWSFETGSSVESSPTVADGTLYVGDSGGSVYALDTSSGNEVWNVETGIGVYSSPTVSGETVFVGSWDNNVYALNTEEGDQEWAFETGGSVWSSPTVADGSVFIGSDDGNLYAIDASNGGELWVFETGSNIRSSPTVANGTVFVGSNDSYVYALSTGVSGSSEGSRINLGTLGHHDNWNYAGQSIDVTVSNEGSGNFEVSIDSTNSPVGGGEPIQVVATITNVGSGSNTQTVTAEITNVGSDSTTVDLEEGSSKTETFNISTSMDDTGSHIIEVSSQDESVSASVAVNESGLNEPDEERGSEAAEGGNTARDADSLGNSTSSNEVDRNGTETTEGSDSEIPITMTQISALGGGAGLAFLLAMYVLRKFGDDANKKPGGKREEDDVSVSGEATPISDTKLTRRQNIDISGVDYDDFEKVEKIGSGGSGDVFKASYDGEIVALKIPRMTDDETLDRSVFDEFISEAKVWSGIDNHERIVSVHAYGEQPIPWIAVEYMQEGNLAMQELSNEQVFIELEGLCEGLYYAHRNGVTHTDIKPENILYKEVNGKPFGKFTDWGLANELLEHSMSVKGFTPEYSAPEQFEPERYGGTDEKTDIYQLGVVAYELFTGELPYAAESSGQTVTKILNQQPTLPTQLNSYVTEDLEQVLLKAIDKNKEDRYETALHFRDDLRRVFDSLTENGSI
jgi:outer membrane protein assembly factor BamB